MFGNVIKHCWQNHTIQHPSDGGQVAKIHTFGPVFNRRFSVDCPNDLLRFNTVRISVPTTEQQLQVAKLWSVKDKSATYQHDVELLAHCIMTWENQYKNYDHLCYKVVEFKDLFDVDILDNLYKNIHQVNFSHKLRRRIQYNIDLNLTLLNGGGSIPSGPAI
jgi:hypothetical protein